MIAPIGRQRLRWVRSAQEWNCSGSVLAFGMFTRYVSTFGRTALEAHERWHRMAGIPFAGTTGGHTKAPVGDADGFLCGREHW